MGNNYIVQPSNELNGPVTLTWKDLYTAGFTFNSPFQLNLANDQVFIADEVIRVIPRRRIVAFGTWLGKSVVAKLFFDPQSAKEHMEKDVAGIKTLRENKIPTPALYYQGYSNDKRVYVLFFERIFDAKNLEQIWREKNTAEELLPILRGVMVELATQHVLGVLQHDLHLKNFLLTKKTIFTLDGAQIELFPNLLSKKMSMDNLALFLSQLGVGVETHQDKLFRHYAKSRGWLLKEEDVSELFLLIKKWNEFRWKKYEKKILRSSTTFSALEDWRTFGVYDRNYDAPEFKKFLKDPDAIFSHPTAVIIKAGRSATVAKVTLDKRELVVKRYNLKSFWHRLRRCLRQTRAFSSWRLAQKLELFGVRTAKPVAFLEKRCLGFRGKSYYVTEYIAGEDAVTFFSRHQEQEAKILQGVNQITELLKNLAKLEITHGDLKATNIIMDEKGKPHLIDLDGAAEHTSFSGLRSAWRKEIRRFLENFNDQPSVCEKFKLELVKG